MIELEINEKNLSDFLTNIRKSDEEELIYHYGKNYRETFIKTVNETKNTYFVGNNNKEALAIGGFQEFKNKNCFQVWLLCTDKITKNKKELLKYIKQKVELYKNNSFVMFNLIYKSNFKSLNMLKKLGFEIRDICDKNFKLFYYTKGNDFDTRYITN